MQCLIWSTKNNVREFAKDTKEMKIIWKTKNNLANNLKNLKTKNYSIWTETQFKQKKNYYGKVRNELERKRFFTGNKIRNFTKKSKKLICITISYIILLFNKISDFFLKLKRKLKTCYYFVLLIFFNVSYYFIIYMTTIEMSSIFSKE